MKKLMTMQPKDVWAFFKELGAERGAFLLLTKEGLAVEETDDVTDPPSVVLDAKVGRESWIVFLQVIVALAGGRPVKVVPATKTTYRVLVGPKS